MQLRFYQGLYVKSVTYQYPVEFSDACKIAKLKPIYKKGKNTDPSNYRHISLLPIISKVIERIVHDQRNKFISENNILHNFQSAFRPNHSTNLFGTFNRQILKGFDEDWNDTY